MHKEIEKQKATEKELVFEFVRINPDRKDHDEYVEFGKIINYINKSNKSNHSIKSNALEYVNKEILPTL